MQLSGLQRANTTPQAVLTIACQLAPGHKQGAADSDSVLRSESHRVERNGMSLNEPVCLSEGDSRTCAILPVTVCEYFKTKRHMVLCGGLIRHCTSAAESSDADLLAKSHDYQFFFNKITTLNLFFSKAQQKSS